MKILYSGSFLLTMVLSLISKSGGYSFSDSIMMVLFWNSILYFIALNNRYLDIDMSKIQKPIIILRTGLAVFSVGLFYHYVSIVVSIL